MILSRDDADVSAFCDHTIRYDGLPSNVLKDFF